MIIHSGSCATTVQTSTRCSRRLLSCAGPYRGLELILLLLISFFFCFRVTSAINSFTAQNRYPGYRQDPLRFGQASNNLGSGRNWSNQAPIGRSTAPLQPSYTRSIRGAQQPLQQSQMQPVNNRNRFVYPPPVQNQVEM